MLRDNEVRYRWKHRSCIFNFFPLSTTFLAVSCLRLQRLLYHCPHANNVSTSSNKSAWFARFPEQSLANDNLRNERKFSGRVSKKQKRTSFVAFLILLFHSNFSILIRPRSCLLERVLTSVRDRKLWNMNTNKKYCTDNRYIKMKKKLDRQKKKKRKSSRVKGVWKRATCQIQLTVFINMREVLHLYVYVKHLYSTCNNILNIISHRVFKYDTSSETHSSYDVTLFSQVSHTCGHCVRLQRFWRTPKQQRNSFD